MTPTTEVRYGEPVVRCTNEDCRSESPYTDEDGCCRTCGADCVVLRYAYEDCPVRGCGSGGLPPGQLWATGPSDPMRARSPRQTVAEPCPTCSDSDRWGIPAGTVRVRCERCEGHGVICGGCGVPDCGAPHVYWTRDDVPCHEIEAGRCYGGYAVRVDGGRR